MEVKSVLGSLQPLDFAPQSVHRSAAVNEFDSQGINVLLMLLLKHRHIGAIRASSYANESHGGSCRDCGYC